MNPRWIDFTPEPPKPPSTIEDGEYICKIIEVQEKISNVKRIEYWHWTFTVEGIHPDFRLHYATPIEDRNKRLAELYKAITGFKAKGKVYINPPEYIGVCVRIKVRRRLLEMRMVNEIVSVKHI